MNQTETTQIEMIDVKRVRELTGLSQQRFADLLGVSRQTVNNWENGSKIPETKMLKLEEIEQRLVGSRVPGHPNYLPESKEERRQFNESPSEYRTAAASNDLMKQFLYATEENRRLNEENRKLMQQMQDDIKIMVRLKNLLEKHNIDYSHITEE